MSLGKALAGSVLAVSLCAVSHHAGAVAVTATDLGGGTMQARFDFNGIPDTPGPLTFEIKGPNTGTTLMTATWSNIDQYIIGGNLIRQPLNAQNAAWRMTFSQNVDLVSLRIYDLDIGENIVFRGRDAGGGQLWQRSRNSSTDNLTLLYLFDEDPIRRLDVDLDLVQSRINFDDLTFTFAGSDVAGIPAPAGFLLGLAGMLAMAGAARRATA